MKLLKPFALSLALTVVCHAAVSANPFQINSDLDQKIKQGLSDLYNLEFDKADREFQSLHDQAADHPMVAFGRASVHWWRLSVYVLETDPKESAAFLSAVDECIRLSREKIDRGDPTGEAHLTLGGAYGLLGRWKATNQEWASAYFTGKKAIKFLRKSLKINPAMKDANMGLGIFDYYVATLPAVVRVLAFLGSGGDPKVGIQELSEAAYQGTYATTPSKLFLSEIYSTPENNPQKAFEILNDLRREYPTSPFIHMMMIIADYNHSQMDDLKKETALFKERVETGVYSKDLMMQAHFALATVPFKNREWEKAVSEYDLAIATGTIKDPFFTWSQLYKGYALDALGKHEEAKASYETVLKQMRRWGSWDAAKKYSSKPFQGTDEELKKLRL